MEVANVGALDAHIPRVADWLAQGGMVLLLEREESAEGGHLVAAAQTVSAETIATMLRETAGMPWLALPADRCEALELSSMAERPRGEGRDMMVTFEAREGVTTGISAADRALSMRVAASPESTAADIVTPGHVLPVRAHTNCPAASWTAAEAAVDLVGNAGLPGGAALCQVMDEDGGPAGGPELRAVAERLKIPLVDSLDILDRRLGRTELVERSGGERAIESPIGSLPCVEYRDRESGALHFAIVLGDVASREPVRVEAIVQDVPAHVFGAQECQARASLRDSLDELARAGRGVLLYLAPTGATGEDRYPGAIHRSHVVTQILRDLGVATILPARGSPTWSDRVGAPATYRTAPPPPSPR